MRKDTHGNPLPPRLHHKNGAYYYVYRNKWTRLASDYPAALTAYGRAMAPASGLGPLLNKVYERYEAQHSDGRLALATIQQYRGVRARIESAFINFEPREVIQSDITAFMDHYEATPNMANRMLTVLKATFERGVRLGLCDNNPAYGVKRFPEGKRKRYLTHAEYAAIRAKANQHTRLIMDLCYLTAQRIGDVLTITHAQIGADQIEFAQQKTGKRLAVKITPEIRQVISEAKSLRKVTTLSPYLLHPAGKSTPYGYHGIRDNYERARTRAKVAHTTIHDIRAKSLTDAKRQGLDAQLLAGHEDESMTKRYIRQREVDLVEGPNLRQVIDN